MALVDAWYRKRAWLWLLWPLSLLFSFFAQRRRVRLERRRILRPEYPPVLIVGNITVGGTGKTPLVIALVKLLQNNGIRPAVISRGYGGTPPEQPYSVSSAARVDEVGDEAILIGRSITCPMLVDKKRARAVAALHLNDQCDVIISDDGLQHYAMERAIEIVVIDGDRLLGNGLGLPAGPLREPAQRLQEVDYVVVNGGSGERYPITESAGRAPMQTLMRLEPTSWVNLATGERLPVNKLPNAAGGKLHAIAGIGNPQRFFNTVRALGYDPLCHPFPDHYRFTAGDLRFAEGFTLVMTQKDAVKCEQFADSHCWYLAIEAQLDADFTTQIVSDVRQKIRVRKNVAAPKN